jgi:curli biogenesis system outer membrane secretion channel CsgG
MTTRNAIRTSILGLLLLGVAVMDASAKKREPEAPTAQALPAIAGPKRSVAVGPFEVKSDFQLRYGSFDLGGGLSAMLTTALLESERFIVVERNQLSSVFSEQELAANGMVGEAGGALPAELVGAQYVILGHLTEFSEADRGGGFGLGLSGSIPLGLGGRKKVGSVGVDVRVVDTTTSRVVAGFHVRQEIVSRAVRADVEVEGVSLGQDTFKQTPLGQATRAAIEEVVRRFAEEIASEPWSGSVVEFTDGEVVINAGADSGVRVGDTFAVYRQSGTLTDPATGHVLGARKQAIGSVVVESVDATMAFGGFLPSRGVAPQRGDLIGLE